MHFIVPSSLQPLAAGLNVANLNLISRFASADDVLVGRTKSDAAVLSAKIIKMCLRHTNNIAPSHDARIGLSGPTDSDELISSSSDAASIVYASIGREILSATIDTCWFE